MWDLSKNWTYLFPWVRFTFSLRPPQTHSYWALLRCLLGLWGTGCLSGHISDSFRHIYFHSCIYSPNIYKLLSCARHCAGSWGLIEIRPHPFLRQVRQTKAWNAVWCVTENWCKLHWGGPQSPSRVRGDIPRDKQKLAGWWGQEAFQVREQQAGWPKASKTMTQWSSSWLVSITDVQTITQVF